MKRSKFLSVLLTFALLAGVILTTAGCGKSAPAEEVTGEALLDVLMSNQFRIENAEGQTLTPEGDDFTGDMEVLKQEYSAADELASKYITVKNSSSFVFTPGETDNRVSFSCGREGGLCSADGYGITRFEVDSANNAVVEGTTDDLRITLSRSPGEDDAWEWTSVTLFADTDSKLIVSFDPETGEITISGMSGGGSLQGDSDAGTQTLELEGDCTAVWKGGGFALK